MGISAHTLLTYQLIQLVNADTIKPLKFLFNLLNNYNTSDLSANLSCVSECICAYDWNVF